MSITNFDKTKAQTVDLFYKFLIVNIYTKVFNLIMLSITVITK